MTDSASPTERGYRAEAVFSTFDRRWHLLWALLPYLLIALAFPASMFASESGPTERVLVSALTLGLLLWHFWFVTMHPSWVEHRPPLMSIYFSGLLLMALTLTVVAESFVLMLTGCYVMAFVALRGIWAYFGVILTGVCLLLSISSFPPSLSLTAQIVGTSLLAAVIGWAMRRVDSEAARRREAHTELLAVTAELQRSNDDKDALQKRLSAAARQSGIAAERARLAREFHDTLAQGLAAISSQLETVDATITEDHPASHRVRTALELSRSSLTEARRSVHSLRPGPLSGATLTAALQETARAWQHRNQMPLRLDLAGVAEPQDDQTKIALLRFAQEALANIERHSQASEATLTVSSVGGHLIIDVFDDGVGFDPRELGEGGTGGGFGLAGARERLAGAGAELNIESRAMEGTTVTAIVPLTRDAGEHS